MVEPSGGELERGPQVFAFEIGHLGEDLVGGETGREELEDVSHPNAHAPNARSPAALLGIDGDTVGKLGHVFVLRCWSKHTARTVGQVGTGRPPCE